MKLNFQAKEKMVELSGACFWYWNGLYSFLDNCGVPKELQLKYPREAYNKYSMMRSILGDLEQAGDTKTINGIASGFYKLNGAVDRDKLDEDRAKRLLQEFRDLLGSDPIEEEIKNRQRAQARAQHQQSMANQVERTSRLEKLKREFEFLSSGEEITPQQRGFRLEELFFELLHLNEYEHSAPYRTPNNEQIDGHFRHDKFDYLVEVKWTSGPTKQPDLSVFDGKIRGKAQSTRGLFISADGFDETAVQKFSGDSPRIILMTGEDLALILGGVVLFSDAMKAKIDAIVRFGKILQPVREIAFR